MEDSRVKDSEGIVSTKEQMLDAILTVLTRLSKTLDLAMEALAEVQSDFRKENRGYVE